MKETEFAQIVNQTKSAALSSIRRHLAARFYYAIDDVAQETYLRVYKALKKNSFKGASSLETWIYAIARNESLRMNDKLKREEIKTSACLKKIREAGICEYADLGAIRDEKKDDLKNLINALPQKYKSVIELISLGFSEKQISEKLAIKKGTVKSRTSRGKELIQRMAKGGLIL